MIIIFFFLKYSLKVSRNTLLAISFVLSFARSISFYKLARSRLSQLPIGVLP